MKLSHHPYEFLEIIRQFKYLYLKRSFNRELVVYDEKKEFSITLNVGSENREALDEYLDNASFLLKLTYPWDRELEPTNQENIQEKIPDNLVKLFFTIKALNLDPQANGFGLDGQGYAYGLEMSFDRSFKNFQLDGNYTFSRSFRKFDEINDGRFFPHIFDRPHNLTLTGVWKINEKTKLSALWTYQTGQPVTMGSQLFPAINNHYFHGGLYSSPDPIRWGNTRLSFPYQHVFEVPLLLPETNSFRMPYFHRLDVSLSHEKEWRNGMRRKLNVSVYNAYNRQNPYFIYAVREDAGIRFKKLTVFPVLPSVSYGVRF